MPNMDGDGLATGLRDSFVKLLIVCIAYGEEGQDT